MAIQRKPGTRSKVKPAAVKPLGEAPPATSPMAESHPASPALKKPVVAPATSPPAEFRPTSSVLPKPTAAPATARAAADGHPVISEEAIRVKAHELWKARGCRDGHAAQDWADAVAMLKAETAKKNTQKTVLPPAQPAFKPVRMA